MGNVPHGLWCYNLPDEDAMCEAILSADPLGLLGLPTHPMFSPLKLTWAACSLSVLCFFKSLHPAEHEI